LAECNGVDFTLFNNNLVSVTGAHLLNDALEAAYVHAIETLQRHDSQATQTEPRQKVNKAGQGFRSEAIQTDITYDEKTIQKLREFVATVKGLKSA
jgi:hypothetical protein